MGVVGHRSHILVAALAVAEVWSTVQSGPPGSTADGQKGWGNSTGPRYRAAPQGDVMSIKLPVRPLHGAFKIHDRREASCKQRKMTRTGLKRGEGSKSCRKGFGTG